MIFGLMAVKVQAGGNFLGLLKITGIAPVAINDFGVFSFWQRLSFASYGFLMYIYKFFIPTDLCTFYAYPTVEQYEADLIFKLGPFAFLGSLGLAVWSAGRTRWLFFGLGFYLATVALVLQFISVGAVIMADRYTYLPYVGWGLVLVGGTTVLSESVQRYVLWAGLALSLAFIPLTQKQIGVWKDSETLWTQVIRLDPQAEQAYSIRGNFYGKKASKAKTPQDQQAFLNKAFADLSMAVQLKSTRPEVFEGLGNIYGMRGEYPKALENYTKALEYDPNKGSVYFNRGVTHSLLKDYDKAAADYTLALEKYPERMLETLNNRAIAYLEGNRPAEALKDLEVLIKQEPQKASYYTNRAVARQQLGDRAGALSDAQRAVQLDPNDAFAKAKLQELSQ
jgi:tetratricopeptide (TPR) repeat protein